MIFQLNRDHHIETHKKKSVCVCAFVDVDELVDDSSHGATQTPRQALTVTDSKTEYYLLLYIDSPAQHRVRSRVAHTIFYFPIRDTSPR